MSEPLLKVNELHIPADETSLFDGDRAMTGKVYGMLTAYSNLRLDIYHLDRNNEICIPQAAQTVVFYNSAKRIKIHLNKTDLLGITDFGCLMVPNSDSPDEPHLIEMFTIKPYEIF